MARKGGIRRNVLGWAQTCKAALLNIRRKRGEKGAHLFADRGRREEVLPPIDDTQEFDDRKEDSEGDNGGG